MKPEIKNNLEPLSNAEIEKNMNFDKFISGYGGAGHARWLGKTAKLWLSVSVAVLAVLGASYFLLNKNNAVDKSAPFIDPPVADVVIKTDKITLDAQRDTTITLPGGTTLVIPAGAFATRDGKEVTGKIELDYREFHDQVDLIFSGIPMHYDTAGKHYQFESAGMFEIKAKQDGQDLVLKAGKELTVNMISYNEENYFNVYYLDTTQKKWVYNADNTRASKQKVAEQLVAKSFSPDMMLEAQKLIEPKKADPSLCNFVIDYDKEEFPELCIYDGVKFEVDKDFDKKLTTVVWHDVFIKRHDEKRYTVTFKYGTKQSSVLATPVLDEKDFQAAMDEYTKRRKAQLAGARRRNDSLLATNANYVRESSNNDLNTKFSNAIKRGTVSRYIVVDNLGMWNCDHYQQIALGKVQERADSVKAATSPRAEFVDLKNDKKVELKMLYLMKRDVNAIYPLGPQEFAKFPLVFLQNVDIAVGVTSDFQVLYLQDEALRSLKVADKKVVLKLHEIDPSNKSLMKIKEMLRI